MARYLFRREKMSIFVGSQLNYYGSTKLIFEGYGQQNSTTISDFLHQACMTHI